MSLKVSLAAERCRGVAENPLHVKRSPYEFSTYGQEGSNGPRYVRSSHAGPAVVDVVGISVSEVRRRHSRPLARESLSQTAACGTRCNVLTGRDEIRFQPAITSWTP